VQQVSYSEVIPLGEGTSAAFAGSILIMVAAFINSFLPIRRKENEKNKKEKKKDITD
jgi:hypothetical protein